MFKIDHAWAIIGSVGGSKRSRHKDTLLSETEAKAYRHETNTIVLKVKKSVCGGHKFLKARICKPGSQAHSLTRKQNEEHKGETREPETIGVSNRQDTIRGGGA
jgi:hypothetical protein